VVPVQWAPAYSKASQNVCNTCTFSAGFYFLQARSAELQGHILPSFTPDLQHSRIWPCATALWMRPAEQRLPSGAQSPQQVYSPCAWVCARYHRHHRHNHKHLLNKQLGSSLISTAPLLPCYTRQ